MDELKPETVNACWKNGWSEIISESNDLLGIDGEVNKVIHTARWMEEYLPTCSMKKRKSRSTEMAQWLRASAAVAEDQDSVTSS